MIETLFVLSIIIIVSTFTLSMIKVQHENIDTVSDIIRYYIDYSRTQAITKHQNISIEFVNDSIIIDDTKIQFETHRFTTSQNITFNKFGNINKATTLTICNQDRCKDIVLQLESGANDVR